MVMLMGQVNLDLSVFQQRDTETLFFSDRLKKQNVLIISDSCMQSPTGSSCTGEDIGGSNSLPDKVDIVYCNRNTISIFSSICGLSVPSKERAAKKPPKTSCIANFENGEKSNLDIEIFAVPWRQVT